MSKAANPYYIGTRTHEGSVVYRSIPITTDRVSRFVRVLIGEIVRSGVHLDAVPVALNESGILPVFSPRRCNDIHADTRTERLNTLADALLSRIRRSVAVHAALVGVATTIISELTSPSPVEHLSLPCVDAFVRCTSDDLHTDHILDYEVYAACLAHLDTCGNCRELIALNAPK